MLSYSKMCNIHVLSNYLHGKRIKLYHSQVDVFFTALEETGVLLLFFSVDQTVVWSNFTVYIEIEGSLQESWILFFSFAAPMYGLKT